MKPVTVWNTHPGSLKSKFPSKPLINLTLCISGRLQLCSHCISADWAVFLKTNLLQETVSSKTYCYSFIISVFLHMKKPKLFTTQFLNQFGHCSLEWGIYYQQLLQQGETSARFLHHLILAGDLHTDLTLQHSLGNSSADIHKCHKALNMYAQLMLCNWGAQELSLQTLLTKVHGGNKEILKKNYGICESK